MCVCGGAHECVCMCVQKEEEWTNVKQKEKKAIKCLVISLHAIPFT